MPHLLGTPWPGAVGGGVLQPWLGTQLPWPGCATPWPISPADIAGRYRTFLAYSPNDRAAPVSRAAPRLSAGSSLSAAPVGRADCVWRAGDTRWWHSLADRVWRACSQYGLHGDTRRSCLARLLGTQLHSHNCYPRGARTCLAYSSTAARYCTSASISARTARSRSCSRTGGQSYPCRIDPLSIIPVPDWHGYDRLLFMKKRSIIPVPPVPVPA